MQFSYAIFRALFVTLIDFVRLMSTIINHKHIVWSAYARTWLNYEGLCSNILFLGENGS